MIKKKTLPFYEDIQLNYYIRSRSNPIKTMEYINNLGALHPVLYAGNLWDTIKRIFKKGKDYTKKAIDYIDQSPILSTVKDIGFDVLKEKTGIDANDYYNTARNVINMNKKDVGNTVNKILDTTKDKVHKYVTRDKTKDNKIDYKQTLKDYYNDIVKTVPQYEPQVKQNFDLFSSGAELSGAGEVVHRNLPKLLMMSKTARGNYTIKSAFKPLLLKYGIKTLTVPKALSDYYKSVESKGRLNLGSGEKNVFKPIQEPSNSGKCGKNKNKIDRYNEILDKLKR